MIDIHGRTIDYMRVSVTDRCNLRCIYCMPEQGIETLKHEDILRFEQILKVVKAAASLGVKKVRYTGGEPLIIRNLDKLVYKTSKIQGIEDIAITTNGILLDLKALDLKKAGLKRATISLDTLSSEKYRKLTRGGDILKVLNSIDKCLKLGLNPVKINTVLMRGINDTEINDFIHFVREMPVEVRFIELMPIGEGIKLYEKNSMSFREVIEAHPELIPGYSMKNSTAEMYTIAGARGKIGFINPMSCKFCTSCNRIRLTSTGTLKPCLHSREEISVKQFLNDEKRLKDILEAAILNKPSEHRLKEEKASKSAKMMYEIGG